VHLYHLGPGARRPALGAQHRVQGRHGQRPGRQDFQPPRREPLAQQRRMARRVCGRAGRVFGGDRGQQAGRLGGEPALRVLKDRGRRTVEPGQVVDPDDHRGGLRERPDHAEEGDRDRSLVRWLGPGLGAQQGHVKRPPLRARQPGERRLGHRFEQIPEGGEAERRLRLDRAAGEHLPPTPAGLVETGRPQRRLADAGLALDQQRRRLAGRLVQEAADPGKLGGTAVYANGILGRPLHSPTLPGDPEDRCYALQ